jgi:hypothetical protein
MTQSGLIADTHDAELQGRGSDDPILIRLQGQPFNVRPQEHPAPTSMIRTLATSTSLPPARTFSCVAGRATLLPG